MKAGYISRMLKVSVLTFAVPCRDAKAHCSAKNLADQIANLGALRSVKCNASGSQVSILISQVIGQRTISHSFLKS